MRNRLLLVDDELQLLFSVKEYLSRVGYDITAAESGAQAMGSLIESPPDLIISDIMMEEMDGFEFQRRVKALTGNSIPFIFLTAKGDLRDRLEGLRGGADDYIVKPFAPEELEARVAAVLGRVEHTREEEHREMGNLRSRILGEVARQLRAPVASITAHLNLMLDDRFGRDQAMQDRYLKSAVEDANILRELIHDLSWAASGDSDLTVKREPIRIAPVVRGAAANAARLASQKGIELQISCGGLLSATIDGAAMSRALAGLLEATVELSPPDSRVRIAATRACEGGLEFVISDGGCQVLANDEDHASDLPTDALDLARQVVKGHGGKFRMRQEEDGRQSIVIWLPGRVAKRIGMRKRGSG